MPCLLLLAGLLDSIAEEFHDPVGAELAQWTPFLSSSALPEAVQ